MNILEIGIEKGREEGRQDGKEEGRQEGEDRFARLTQLLMDAKRSEDLSRAITDRPYREKLYQEYGL